MKALHDLQVQFQRYLLGQGSEILDAIVVPPVEPAADRLDIYYHAYSLRLLEVLSKTFPVLFKLMGEDAFYEMAMAYLAAYPSQSYAIAQFGRYLAVFLKSYASQQPWLAEMAALEWGIQQVAEAERVPSLALGDLAAIQQEDWPGLSFALLPSVKLLAFDYASLTLWQAYQDGASQLLQPEAVPQFCILWRQDDLVPYYQSLPDAAGKALSAFEQGLCFAEVCEQLAANMPEVDAVEYVVARIIEWLQAGWLMWRHPATSAS